MNPVVLNFSQHITDLVKRESEAITELLRTQSVSHGSAPEEAIVTDAQQQVIEIAKLIAMALKPA